MCTPYRVVRTEPVRCEPRHNNNNSGHTATLPTPINFVHYLVKGKGKSEHLYSAVQRRAWYTNHFKALRHG